jgi:Ca2+/Na+ antiporter
VFISGDVYSAIFVTATLWFLLALVVGIMQKTERSSQLFLRFYGWMSVNLFLLRQLDDIDFISAAVVIAVVSCVFLLFLVYEWYTPKSPKQIEEELKALKIEIEARITLAEKFLQLKEQNIRTQLADFKKRNQKIWNVPAFGALLDKKNTDRYHVQEKRKNDQDVHQHHIDT